MNLSEVGYRPTTALRRQSLRRVIDMITRAAHDADPGKLNSPQRLALVPGWSAHQSYVTGAANGSKRAYIVVCKRRGVQGEYPRAQFAAAVIRLGWLSDAQELLGAMELHAQHVAAERTRNAERVEGGRQRRAERQERAREALLADLRDAEARVAHIRGLLGGDDLDGKGP